MGELLGGGFRSAEPSAQDLLPFEAKEQIPGRGSPTARQASPRDTRHFLESNVLVGPPRPWGAPPDKANFHKADDPERLRASLIMPKWYPQEALPALPAEMLRVEQEAASARLAVRLAACERRVEAQEANEARETESLQRLELELRQMHEGKRTFAKLAEERLMALESGLERTQRQDAAVREHIGILQKDFREFAVTAVGRQRAEIELEVSNAFAQQNATAEEWRGTLKQRDAQLQAELQRLGNSVDDASSELVRAQAELRTRISALEAGRLAGRERAVMSPGPMGEGLGAEGGHVVDYLRQQVDALRQTSEHCGARLAELWARCEGEAVSQHSLKQDSDAKFVSLSKAIATERENLSLRVSQRLEVLESRLGVERSEQAAKQAELHDQVASGDHQGFVQLQDLSSKFRTELESAERRLQGEISTLRINTEADLAQLSSSRATEEEVRRSSMASLLQRLEGSTHSHTETSNSLRQEVDASVRDLRETLRAESSARIDAERKLATDSNRAAQTLASELSALQKFAQKQAESVASELDRMRWNNTDRADRLSRYVDEKVAMVVGDPSNSRIEAETASLEERLAGMKAVAEEQARLAEQRVEACAEDIRNRLRQAEESWMRDAQNSRRESDRSTTAVERRTLAAQDELKARFEAYVKHFDSAIASVQAAILRPPATGASPRDPQLLPISPGKVSPSGRKAGWPNAGPALPGQVPARSLPSHEHWRPAAAWQNEELRCVVDGLRVHEEPDLASQVRASLARGETVTVKDVLERDRRRWASLGGCGGFVLAFSEGGTPLLEALSAPSASQPLFTAGGAAAPLAPAVLPARSASQTPKELFTGGGAAAPLAAPPVAEPLLYGRHSPTPLLAPAEAGEEGDQTLAAAAPVGASPLTPQAPISPMNEGESVQQQLPEQVASACSTMAEQQLAEQVASNACSLEIDAEEDHDGLRNMVRDLLAGGVASGELERALEDGDERRDEGVHSPEQVLSPDAAPSRPAFSLSDF